MYQKFYSGLKISKLGNNNHKKSQDKLFFRMSFSHQRSLKIPLILNNAFPACK